jgi:hypothetical protein
VTPRHGVLLVFLCTVLPAQEAVRSWYPLEAGDTWVYAKESLDGAMDRPNVERWTTEETVVSVVSAPELGATLVTKRVKVLDHTIPAGFIAANDSTRHEIPEAHLLVRGNCVYLVDGPDAGGAGFVRDALHSAAFRDELLHGNVPADFCFPMAAGKKWGRVPHTSPAEEYIWRVDRMNGDSYGPPGARTFHLSAHIGSGDWTDRWFTEGIGVAQENSEHHGTYDEQRKRLLRSTIAGQTRTYDLPPARTVPLSEYDCAGPAWRHFVHPDGTPFRGREECVAASRPRRSR